MSWLDWTLLAVLLLSAVIGLWRGLVYEVLSLAVWVGAFLLAQAYAEPAGAWLPLEEYSEPLQVAMGFAAVFLAAAFTGSALAWLIKKLVESVGLRPVDRVLGGAFGLLRGVVILLGVTMVVNMTPLKKQERWRDSPVAAQLSSTLQAIRPMLPEALARHLS